MTEDGGDGPAANEASEGSTTDPMEDDRATGPSDDEHPTDPNGDDRATVSSDDDSATGPSGDDRTGNDTNDDRTTPRMRLVGRVRLQWAIRYSVVVAFVGAVVFGGVQFGYDTAYALLLPVGVAVLGVAWIVLRYRVWIYQVREDALYLERGVFRHVRTVVPFVRIQHVDTSRGPLERALGLSTLVVYTAGSRGADVSIPGLTPDVASSLQQQVKELAIEAEEGEGL